MSKLRWISTLVVSILMGAAAVGLAAAWLGQKADLATTQVVVAARDVDIGATLGPEHLTTVAWPTLSAPAGHATKPGDLVGRVVKTGLYRGEPVIEAKLSPPGAKGGLSALISPGKRAVTVRVNEVVGVAGFALPGNYVDIVVSTRDAAGSDISRIVLENVLVLAVAQQADRDETKPKVVNAVTLELSPEQVEILDLARSVGQLSLVLRSQFESTTAGTRGARREDLLGGPRVSAPLPAAPAGAPAPTQAAANRSTAPRPASAPAKPAANNSGTAQASKESSQTVNVEVIRGLTRSTAELPSSNK